MSLHGKAITGATPFEAAGQPRGLAEAAVNASYRKVFWRLMPLLMLCYVVAYLDRVNVGFAKLQMSQQLRFSETVYGFGAGVFFIGYFLFEIPSSVVLNKIGARVWLSRIMVTWGVVSGCFMFVQNAPVFYVMRFLLGAAEAGFYPGIILYLTAWFPAHRRAKVIAVFMSAIPVAGIFGNPLSGQIMDLTDGLLGLAGWQWMFVIEAIPAIVAGLALYLCLDNRPADAKWLSAAEKSAMEDELSRDQVGKHSPLSLGSVFRDGRIWLMSFIYFAFVTGQYGLTFWMPTLVKSIGVTGNSGIGFVSAIPFVSAALVMAPIGWSADRSRERRWHLIVPALLGAIGFVMAASGTNIAVSIGFLSLAAAGVLTCAPLFWSLPTAFLTGTGAATGIALINSVGNLAGFASPYMIGALRDYTKQDQAGMYALALMLVLGSIAVFLTPPRLVNR